MKGTHDLMLENPELIAKRYPKDYFTILVHETASRFCTDMHPNGRMAKYVGVLGMQLPLYAERGNIMSARITS